MDGAEKVGRLLDVLATYLPEQAFVLHVRNSRAEQYDQAR